MFLLVSVILSAGGSASVHAGIPPPGSRHPPCQEQTPSGSRPPQEQTPPRSRYPPRSRHPLGADTPQEQTPPGADTPQQTPPGADTPLEADTPLGNRHPTWKATSSIRWMSGRYTSYRNAFLFVDLLRSYIKLCFSVRPSLYLAPPPLRTPKQHQNLQQYLMHHSSPVPGMLIMKC